jgi:hypothetical protein
MVVQYCDRCHGVLELGHHWRTLRAFHGPQINAYDHWEICVRCWEALEVWFRPVPEAVRAKAEASASHD